MIALDTDVLIEIFDRKSAVGEEILGKIEGYKVATTSINLHEIVYGFYKVKKEIIKELMEFNILEYTRSDALLSAKLESALEKICRVWAEIVRLNYLNSFLCRLL